MTTVADPAPIGTALRPHRRRRQGPRHRDVRLRAPGRDPLHLYAAAVDDRARPRHRDRHHRGRGRSTASSPSSPHVNAPRLADTSDGELHRAAGRRRRTSAASSSAPWSPRPPRSPGTAAELVRVEYDVQPHDTELRADHPDLYAPSEVNPAYPTDTEDGDVDAALRGGGDASTRRYTTPMEHNNPMEPHAMHRAVGGRPRLTLYDSTQGAHGVAQDARDGVRDRAGPDPGRRAVRRRRVRLQGAPHAHNVLGRAGRATVPRPPGEAGADPAADVRPRRLPHPDHPAGPARRRADGTIARIGHEVVEQTSRSRSSPSRPRSPTRMHVRRRRTGDQRTGWRARRGRAVLDARAGRVPRHVRPRGRDGRARGRLRHRPDRAADPQRTRRRPRDRQAVVGPPARRVPADRRRAVRLGAPAIRARAPARRRAGWSAPASRRRCTPRWSCPATPRASSTSRRAGTPCRSAPSTSVPAPGPR